MDLLVRPTLTPSHQDNAATRDGTTSVLLPSKLCQIPYQIRSLLYADANNVSRGERSHKRSLNIIFKMIFTNISDTLPEMHTGGD